MNEIKIIHFLPVVNGDRKMIWPSGFRQRADHGEVGGEVVGSGKLPGVDKEAASSFVAAFRPVWEKIFYLFYLIIITFQVTIK